MLSFKRALTFIAILSANLMLTGCFKPVYMPSNVNNVSTPSIIQTELASVEITKVNSRLGLELRNELNFLLQNENAQHKYFLELELKETGIISITDPATGRAEAYATGLRAKYKLKKLNDLKTVILTSTAIADTAYDRPQQRYAALRAARDSQLRAAKVVAEQIHLQLSSYFQKEHAQK